MSSLYFLTFADILLFHKKSLEQFGGSSGIRDAGLLESAIEQAKFIGKFSNNDSFEIAAGYLFHIIQNHAFIDGNKRTGVIACLTFLDFNGYVIKCTPDQLYDLTINVAEGKLQKSDIVLFLKSHARPAVD